MLISIIIPYYKGEKFIATLLISISQAIENVIGDFSFEIILVIDSIETEVETIKNLTEEYFFGFINVRIKVLKNTTNMGVAGTRNRAIKESNGDFLHIIDQDDLVKPKFYSKVTALFHQYNFILVNGVACYTNKKYNSHKLYYFAPLITIKGLLCDDFIRSPGQVVFSKFLSEKSSFPEPKEYKGADDRFFWISLMIQHKNKIKATYIAEPEYIANIHENNYSNDGVNLKRSALEVWNLIEKKSDFKIYTHLITNDKLRLRYGINDGLNTTDKIFGLWLNIKYFLTLNKLVRFLIKRKW